jgi:Spy/CpxP family protein refolding chaperone
MTFKMPTFRAFRLPLIVMALGAAFVFGKEDRPGKGIDRMVAKMEKELKLTKEQSAKIRTILSQDTAEMRAMHAEKGMPHHGSMHGDGPEHGKGKMGGMGMMGGPEFVKQLRAEKVDTDALNKVFDERQARMRTMHNKHIAKFVAIHDVLTAEQRAKAADEMEKRAAKMEKLNRK